MEDGAVLENPLLGVNDSEEMVEGRDVCVGLANTLVCKLVLSC